jgi:hypothetical protein
MKYSLRSLMIAVLVLPPLLAWGAMPLYRWLTTPKAPAIVTSGAIDDTFSDLPHYGRGATSAEAPDLTFELPTAEAPAPNPPKP